MIRNKKITNKRVKGRRKRGNLKEGGTAITKRRTPRKITVKRKGISRERGRIKLVKKRLL